jgi:hypothetical protein
VKIEDRDEILSVLDEVDRRLEERYGTSKAA